MKRLLIAFLSACLLLSACSQSGETQDPAQDPAGDAQQEETSAGEETPAEETPAGEEAPEEESPAQPDRGSFEGQVYTNEWAGFSITIPDELTLATEEEMAQIYGQGNQQIAQGNETVKDTLDQWVEQVVTPMFIAQAAEGQPRLKVTLSAEAKNNDVTESEYLTTAAQTVLVADSGYAFGEQEELKLAGSVYTKVTGQKEDGSVMDLYARRMDGYMLLLTFSYDQSQAALVGQCLDSMTALEA